MLRQGLLKLRVPGSALARFSSKIPDPDAIPVEDAEIDKRQKPLSIPRLEKSVNQVTLLGRVGGDPQLRGTEEHPVTVFSLATHTNFKYQSGDIQQKTEWHRICVFRPFLRDSVYKYMSKGQRCLVQGKIMYGQITDAGGTVHTTTSIIAEDVVFFNKGSGSGFEDDMR